MIAALVSFLWRRPRAVLFTCALVFAGAAALATRLELKTNFAELLPSRDPAVVTLTRMAARIGATAMLQIVIEGPDREANRRVADELGARLRELSPDVLDTALWEVHAEKAFFHERRWLYAPEDELVRLRDALSAERARRKNPLLVDLEDSESARALADRLRARAVKAERFPTGYFEGEGGRLFVIVCRPPGTLFGERAGERLLAEAEKVVAETRLAPGMRVGFTGDVMAQLEERRALENDLVWATAIAVTLVCLVVVLFFGRLGALALVGGPALLGVALAFAAAELGFGYLNASTAFMGSIIVGNGINFPIIVLARYEEERRSGQEARAAAERALAKTVRPTLVAAFGAALAYGSLALTRFRGFSQFGAIGAVGMVAAWVATLIVLPAAWAAFDRRPPVRALPPVRIHFARAVASLATRAPRGCLVVFALVTAFSVVPLRRYLHDPFEYDFRNLRNRRSIEHGAESLAPRVDPIFGLTLTPSVVLADRSEDTAEIRRVILDRDRARARPLLGDVTTLESFLPGDAKTQARKLALLDEIRALLPEDEPERPPPGLRPLGARELPASIRRPFTEADGTLGRVVLVYHDRDVSVWDGRNLLGIAQLIEEIPLARGEVVRSSGHAVVFAAMIRAITRDAPRAALASLAGVALLVLAIARRRGGLVVMGALLAGVLWMLGAAAWLGVRTNFLNFIALPITFGIGVDYGINIFSRIRQEEAQGPGAAARATLATGGAVALCSLTTIIGYAALLVADNLALRSCGAMAILGEAACLSAAVIALPAFFIWRGARAPRTH